MIPDKFQLKLKEENIILFSSSADSTEECPYNIININDGHNN